ncbi:caa(3)-type oxidase, subunit IV [Leptospira broomii serovar Hurstbridge str. 5399]|uniref:Caa(3)-type oxidase, subunit IV n=1 Tax=Leptospira broomii serovar Hurstbridge str. 5399 TaxID=1049789 RepID=T0FB30_9LEPT|nr:cytochrome C oxidase subunit IV family protein [Leptospira broomii]EQA45071.1 caa(3)-type oxidase, subunit IV [Leptospira broomii serovar Hurstbridge str. 5399]
MELFLNYSLYIIVSIGFLIPFTGLVVGGGAIVSTTVAGFVVNFAAQIVEEDKLKSYLDKNKGTRLGKALQQAVDAGKTKLQPSVAAVAPSTSHAADEGHGEHHLISIQTYSIVFAALIIGTILTVWVAGIDFGAANTVIAMLVATIKASLVLAYFMHLKYDNLMNRAIFGSGFLFLLLLFGFCAADIFTRSKIYLGFPY